MAERITSRANPLMVHIRKLASSRAGAQEAGRRNASRKGTSRGLKKRFFMIGSP